MQNKYSFFYKLILSYKGTCYNGWQIQDDAKTVQGTLNMMCEKILSGKAFRTIGCGRTDSGVHALEQVVKLESEQEVKIEKLKSALGSLLPNDITLVEALTSTEAFHPISDCEWKEYTYLFSSSRPFSPLYKDLVTYIPYTVDLDRMRKGCELFVGEHDFKNYQNTGTEVSTTVRRILSIDLQEHNENHAQLFTPAHVSIRIKGNGFLKQMVRLMIGALWSVGRSKVNFDQIQDSLINPKISKLGATAPPEGLYLSKVFYP